ncbi:S3 self-incompatibility locus-linked pollen [Olea europaea subsp. europaea]|uniref:S3 self-incompatibility locus-linked pollen n=1 Tax=Olea europaea subsp. europaea TaxID=158383 RepID=A0A8S0P7Y2_OLEEU|nr:S3 self-incompatibility locus-linked pollen [Olea europaea subsp. europaea]
MDPEQTFIRVQERFSEMLTPKVRVMLEYLFLFLAITLFCVLIVMHANYVQQPGCSSELSEVETSEAQLIYIKIASAGLWSQNKPEYDAIDAPKRETENAILKATNVDGDGLPLFGTKSWLTWISSGAKVGKSPLKFWSTDNDVIESQQEASVSSESFKTAADDMVVKKIKDGSRGRFFLSPKESTKAAIVHLGRKWHGHISFFWRLAKRILGGLWDIAGINLNFDIPKWLKILHFDRLNSFAVQWLEKRSKAFEPTYLYMMEKGYFLLPEEAKSRHSIRTINISFSARHTCFGNRWQQLLINRLVGYDTILMNSLLNSPGQGYLYNYQTKEFYNLTYAHEQPESYAKFGDYLVTKCGVLMMSLFVFFTTTMSVSFTLRETQTRMLKFTVQLQHHAQHRLPTFQLIFVHVIESLVFVPIMIGILFFLFEFYDDQLLAFMVLILVWLCELFTLISVRTPISMKFFPRFFLLYFLVFHIYFFSYTHGFSYLALSTTAAFMQHLILYFWNRFEVPALQRFMQNRRSHFQQHPDFHITSSTILASTLHITRLNTRNPGPLNTDLASGPVLRTGTNTGMPRNGATAFSGPQEQPSNDNPERLRNPLEIEGQAVLNQPEGGGNPGAMNSFSSLLLWILGGASSESLNSFLSIFRDFREHGQVFTEPPRQENRTEPHNE